MRFIEPTVQLINFSLRNCMLLSPRVSFSISTIFSLLVTVANDRIDNSIHVIIVISQALVSLSLDVVWLACTLVGLSSVLLAYFLI